MRYTPIILVIWIFLLAVISISLSLVMIIEINESEKFRATNYTVLNVRTEDETIILDIEYYDTYQQKLVIASIAFPSSTYPKVIWYNPFGLFLWSKPNPSGLILAFTTVVTIFSLSFIGGVIYACHNHH